MRENEKCRQKIKSNKGRIFIRAEKKRTKKEFMTIVLSTVSVIISMIALIIKLVR